MARSIKGKHEEKPINERRSVRSANVASVKSIVSERTRGTLLKTIDNRSKDSNERYKRQKRQRESTAESSAEKTSLTENSTASSELSKNERLEIWMKLESYIESGMNVTSWGYCAPVLEIFYVLDTNLLFDEISASRDLTDFLQPALKDRKIRLIQLLCKPQYKQTLGPGSRVSKRSDVANIPGVQLRNCPPDPTTCWIKRVGSLGAFVNVQGKGTHALLSGHDKHEHDELIIEETQAQLGTVKVVLLGNSPDHEYRDVALAQLDPQHTNVRNTIMHSNQPINLSRVIQAPVAGAAVRKFASTTRKFIRGKIRHTTYNCYSINSPDGKLENCITIIRSWPRIRGRKRAFHDDGESGILATTLPTPPGSNQVHAVGMLVGVTKIIPKGRKKKEMSVAVPMETILTDLSRASYSRGPVTLI